MTESSKSKLWWFAGLLVRLPIVAINRMRFYGDAAVYIQHETYPLAPGKSIYVWMRTAEALGPDQFYPSLFQFISTKLERPK